MTYSNPTGLCSVTEAFSPHMDWSKISKGVLEAACDRGERVHDAIAADLCCEWHPVDDDIRGYFDAYRSFSKVITDVLYVEKRFECLLYQYTGKVDLVCKIQGDDKWTLVDWKTSAIVSKSWPLQCSAYATLVNNHQLTLVKRTMAVQLRKNGTFKVNEYVDIDSNYRRFLAALTSYQHFNTKQEKINWEAL
jgi:hypothetical protein